MPVDRLTSAMEEAYAAAPCDVVILHTLEIRNAVWSAPIRIITGEGLTPGEVITLTLETGTTADFVAMAYDIIPPGFDNDGPTSGKIRIDGVSGELVPEFEAVAMSAGTIAVTYRSYRSDARFEPGDIITGLKMRSVAVTATAAEGEIGFDEVGKQAFPRITYNIDDYPGLFQQ